MWKDLDRPVVSRVGLEAESSSSCTSSKKRTNLNHSIQRLHRRYIDTNCVIEDGDLIRCDTRCDWRTKVTQASHLFNSLSSGTLVISQGECVPEWMQGTTSKGLGSHDGVKNVLGDMYVGVVGAQSCHFLAFSITVITRPGGRGTNCNQTKSFPPADHPWH